MSFAGRTRPSRSRPARGSLPTRAGECGAGLIPRRRASARGARLAEFVLFVLVDLAGAFGDAGAVGSSRIT